MNIPVLRSSIQLKAKQIQYSATVTELKITKLLKNLSSFIEANRLSCSFRDEMAQKRKSGGEIF
jgi:hypothetical protein